MKNVSEKIQKNLIIAIPTLLSFFAMILAEIPTPLPGIEFAMPLWVLMNVFFWCIYWPESMSRLTLIVTGFMQDILYVTPFGVTALIYILAWWVLVEYRKYFANNSFVAFWILFSCIAFVHMILFTIIGFYETKEVVLNYYLLFQWIFSVLCYPLVHRTLVLIYERLIRRYA